MADDYDYFGKWSAVADSTPIGSVMRQVPDAEGGLARGIGTGPIIYVGRIPGGSCLFVTAEGVQRWSSILFRQLVEV